MSSITATKSWPPFGAAVDTVSPTRYSNEFICKQDRAVQELRESHLKGGKVLAVSSDKRLASLPNVPPYHLNPDSLCGKHEDMNHKELKFRRRHKLHICHH